MPTDPAQSTDLTLAVALISAGVAVLVALITSCVSAWVAVTLQKDRLRSELKLEFATESAIRELLSSEKWTERSFQAIQKRLQGFEQNELRKLLIRSGAVSFEGKDGEVWGLRELNKDRL